jgi:hypothetical protein
MILGINIDGVRIVLDSLVVLFVSEGIVSQSVTHCHSNEEFGSGSFKINFG